MTKTDAVSCSRCAGTGRCPHCRKAQELMPGRPVMCTRCQPTGVCPYCHGNKSVADSSLRAADQTGPITQRRVQSPSREPTNTGQLARGTKPIRFLDKLVRDKRPAEKERRLQPRIPARLDVEVRFDSWEVYRLAWTENISQGGVLVQLRYEPPVGKDVDLKLRLPSGELVGVPAEVRHVHELEVTQTGELQPGMMPRRVRVYEVGMQFSATGLKHRRVIDGILAKLRNEYAKSHADGD